MADKLDFGPPKSNLESGVSGADRLRDADADRPVHVHPRTHVDDVPSRALGDLRAAVGLDLGQRERVPGGVPLEKRLDPCPNQSSRWYGTEVTTVPLRKSRRPFRKRALWLWRS